MSEIILNVKNDSVRKFLNDMLTNPPNMDRHDSHHDDMGGVYGLMQDVLLFKRDGIEIGSKVKIQLNDHSRGSGKPLCNHYEYTAKEYDDISVVMKLTDFKVTLGESD